MDDTEGATAEAPSPSPAPIAAATAKRARAAAERVASSAADVTPMSVKHVWSITP